jgi:hypothetical protein
MIIAHCTSLSLLLILTISQININEKRSLIKRSKFSADLLIVRKGKGRDERTAESSVNIELKRYNFLQMSLWA